MAGTKINLTSGEQEQGVLPVANGGTGATTLSGAGIEQTANKNATSGYAGLNSSGYVAPGQLGSGSASSSTALTGASSYATFVAPGGALGTPSSGTLTNCTFPTLNQSTTGNAATATTASACSGNAATATTLATARTINGVSFNGSANITLPAVPWCPEANICQGTLAVGYNDLPGGFAVEPGINASGVTLQAVWIRMGTIGATFAASSVFDVYVGTATTQGTLAVSITMSAAATNQIATLGTPVSMSANAVVRIYCSTAGAAVAGPIHAQLRGVYNG